ncbi:MAG: histidine kinase dimerization/phosphoacceptor domain -containing protein, partial [Draconibacterium sp.]|nr:histidine kinase dimerization/phosphoacceptor domain -containing protein [Draconibacterium sp.]
MKLMPKADYTDYYDRARFELTWVITSAIFFAMVLFSVTATVLTPEFATVAIISIFLSFLLLVNLWFSRKFKRTAIAFVVLGILLSIIQLFIVQEMLHLVDLIWFFVIALFSFFTLGMMWGLMTVFSYISSFILYIIFFLNENISAVAEVDFETKIAMVVNAALAGTLLFYVVYKFYTTNKFAEKKYHIVNKRLVEKNELIKKKNEANEIMLKEIHHRVKNNLQIITSLLRLQSREMQSEESEVNFREAIDRVAAMAMIHEKLYQEDLSKIELDNYIRSLIE